MASIPKAQRTLDPANLPDLEVISADDASIYLCHFLTDLLRIHGSINSSTGVIGGTGTPTGTNSSNGGQIDPKSPPSGVRDTPPDFKSIDEATEGTPEGIQLMYGLITPAALENTPSGQISPLSMATADSGSAKSPEIQRTLSPTPGHQVKRRLSSMLLEEAAAVAALIGDLGQDRRALRNSCIVEDTSTGAEHSTDHSSESAVIDDENDAGQCKSRLKSSAHDQRVICRRFYSKKAPEISLWQYIQRMQKYCPMAPSVYIAAGVYIYELCIVMRMIPLTSLSVHRLLLASLRIACKSLEDIVHPHKRFAAVGGVASADLYRLEVALLFLLEFNVSVTLKSLCQGLGVFAELAVQTKNILGPLNEDTVTSSTEGEQQPQSTH